MEKNKKIQTSPPRLYSYSEKRNRNRNKTLNNIKKHNLLNNTDNFRNNKKKEKKGEDNLIKLQNGKIIGKLYKKTNETEWETQNRGIKEKNKNQSNYEINLIFERYKCNEGKLNFLLNNKYINLLSELLYSKNNENYSYPKERLKLYNFRINLSKKNKKEFNNILDIYSNNLNKSDNNTVSIPYKKGDNNNLKEKIYFKTFYKSNKFFIRDNYNYLFRNSANNNNSKSMRLLNKKINTNHTKIYDELKNIDGSQEPDKTNNNLILLSSLHKRNRFNKNRKSLKYNNLNNIKYHKENNNESNHIYLQLFNNPNELKKKNNINDYLREKICLNNKKGSLKDIDKFSNKSINSLDKSNTFNFPNDLKNVNNGTSSKSSRNNTPKQKQKKYKNERDIYFEKENEEDEFLAFGDKDKYEYYLKNKYGFYEDIQDKQTQYIYEIKKRNIKLFNNKNITKKNFHKYSFDKISKIKNNENSNFKHGYTIHDIFKEKFTRNTVNKIKLNHKSQKLIKKLKIALK